MNSNQVKAALRQMADFHAAVVHAHEILEAVEAAEKKIKDADKEVQARQKQLSELHNVEEHWRAKDAQARTEHEQAVKALGQQREQLTAGLGGLKRQVADQEQALRAAVVEKNKTIENLNGQIAEAHKTLEKVKAEIDRLKKAFAA